ncbi:hypothetical protein TYRP_010653 [Tyrophagus putrescentiae]|nr:hypothetical protein TYRP_022972 [Tyrophagus putrescentiae]KAH9409643.1 hypothetical protein TYRP_010653 [Tyrophagus putrescentiae]
MSQYPPQQGKQPSMMEPPPPYTAQPGVHPAPPPGFVAAYPPQGYPTPAPVTATVIVRQGFGPYPMQVTCSNCNAAVMTETSASPGLLTWLLSGTLLLVGCWLGCCLIPCCIPECQDIDHRCPNCKIHIGTYRRL